MNVYFKHGMYPLVEARARNAPEGDGAVGVTWALWEIPFAANDDKLTGE